MIYYLPCTFVHLTFLNLYIYSGLVVWLRLKFKNPISLSYTMPLICIEWSLLFMQYVKRYSRKSLRVLGSVGEPINPSAWRFSSLVVWSKHSFHSSNTLLTQTLFGTGGFIMWLEIQDVPFLTLGGKLKLVALWYFRFCSLIVLISWASTGAQAEM